MSGSYGKFAAMIATSTMVMFALMYVNTYQAGHIFWSETRAYMAINMGAVMAAIMLCFMLKMYNNRIANLCILAGAAIVFATGLFLVRSQDTIEDAAWMKAMIPHNSMAILTSERADISDPRVRALADRIISGRLREIDDLKTLIADIESGE